ncbi:MAG TPA: signal peptidase I [Bacillota bacterium]|nr:signal peptidase I [Bacillota bacterium]
MTVSTKSKKNELWEWSKALIIAIGLAYFIRSFLFAPYVVDGHSMETTLHDQERVFVNKLVYLVSGPKRGDIIVFHATKEKDFVKRVIGLPGDKVQVKDDLLYINDQKVDEPYIETEKQQFEKQGKMFTGDFGPVEVPQGKIFVMGDNRQNSLDSRFEKQLGPVDESQIVGRSEFVFWPLTNIRKS